MYLQTSTVGMKQLAGHPLSRSAEQLDCGVFGWQREGHSWLSRGRAPLEPVGGHSLLGRKVLRGRSCVLMQTACALCADVVLPQWLPTSTSLSPHPRHFCPVWRSTKDEPLCSDPHGNSNRIIPASRFIDHWKLYKVTASLVCSNVPKRVFSKTSIKWCSNDK